MTTGTLLSLPAQRLPKGDLVDGVFITIWWFAVTCFAFILSWLLGIRFISAPMNWLFPRSRPTWSNFKGICLGAWILTFWYFFTMIDRWLHYDQRVSVSYGYIVFIAAIESLRVLSAILLAWGTYDIVWVEIEIYFDKAWQGYLWSASKVALFLVALVSIFYVVLYLALTGVWLSFRSLNSIADIATKRTTFEISMTALLTAFALLTLGNAAYAILVEARKIDGRGNDVWKKRLYLLLATFMFFMRSLVEFAIVLYTWMSPATRRSTTLSRDVSYGLLSCLYLFMICINASVVSSPKDKGGKDIKIVRSNLRRHIEQKLRDETNEGRIDARPFADILTEMRADLDNNKDNITAELYAGSTISSEANRDAIIRCLDQLRIDFGHLGEIQIPDSTSPDPSAMSFQFHDHVDDAGGRRKPSGPLGKWSSDPNIQPSKKPSSWSLRTAIRNGRNSAPPIVPENGSPSNNIHRPIRFNDDDTASNYTFTDAGFTSRRNSALGSQRISSAPAWSNRLPAHVESPHEMTTMFSDGRPSNSPRVFSDPSLYGTTQRGELGEREPLSPQEMYGRSPVPAHAHRRPLPRSYLEEEEISTVMQRQRPPQVQGQIPIPVYGAEQEYSPRAQYQQMRMGETSTQHTDPPVVVRYHPAQVAAHYQDPTVTPARQIPRQQYSAPEHTYQDPLPPMAPPSISAYQQNDVVPNGRPPIPQASTQLTPQSQPTPGEQTRPMPRMQFQHRSRQSGAQSAPPRTEERRNSP